MYEHIFSPITIGTVEIKNRLAMTAMGTDIANFDGTPSEDIIEYYRVRAEGGCGLIFTETCRVNDVHGVADLKQLSLTRDENIVPMKPLIDAVHNYGTKIFCQLHHPGRETFNALIGGQPDVAPSAIPCKYCQQETRALETAEVKALVQDFVSAAVRAKQAGFDGVEVHGAHGYLVGSFMSPYTNKRTDEYGGSFENRMRFATEIITGIKEACGKDYPVVIRISADEFLCVNGVTEDYIHTEDGVQIALAMEKAGVDAIDVSCGIYESGGFTVDPTAYPQGWKTLFIKPIKDAVSVPVIAVNHVREPEVAEKLLADGVQDIVAMGRAWLADPDWGEKARTGKSNEIRKCIGCMYCFQTLMERIPLCGTPDCAINPRTFKEAALPKPAIDETHRHVVVIGGGPAGMCAALTAAEREMRVTLLEKSERLGGLVNYASASPVKADMRWVIDWYAQQLTAKGVDVRLNTEANVDLLKQLAPDAIIVATGADVFVPGNIVGVDQAHVYNIYDVLGGTSGLQNNTVAIIGAGITGLECGEYLNSVGCKTMIIDMTETPAPNDFQPIVLDDCGRLMQAGTQFIMAHALKEIRKDAVVLTSLATNEDVIVPCDAVVLSMGLRSNNAIVPTLKETFANVYDVGGAVDAAGKIGGAVNSAYSCVLNLFTE